MQISRYCRQSLAVLFCLTASVLHAQVTRLPAVTADEQYPYPGQLTSYPGAASELIQTPGALDVVEQPERPPGARSGMFQKLMFDSEWLGPGEAADGFGLSNMHLRTVLALPIPSRDYPLIITPGFAVYELDGPLGGDLPAKVYDAYTQFRWMRRLSPRWGIDLAVTPGMFSDFQQDHDDAFRITGHMATQWEYSETLKFVMGAAYIDRYSTDFLPICGLTWTPHDDVKYDLVFPHPRISRRIYMFGAYSEEVQHWVYTAGELGGGIWAVERTGGLSDLVDYTDYRLNFGIERKTIGGLDAHFEVGYVFGRKVRYDSPTPMIEPADTFMLRGGLAY